MTERDTYLSSAFSHIGNVEVDEADLIFNNSNNSNNNEKKKSKKNKVTENPINILNKIVNIANRKPSLKQKLTEEKIKSNAKKLFLQYLEEFYEASFDEEKF